MSTAKRSISVSRTYKPQADTCLQALITLLKKPVNHEGSPTLATLGDAKVRPSSDDSRAKSRIP